METARESKRPRGEDQEKNHHRAPGGVGGHEIYPEPVIQAYSAEVEAAEREQYPGVANLTVPETSRGDVEGPGACPSCPGWPARGYPLVGEALWLHAVRYTGRGFDYRVPLPAWASGVTNQHPAFGGGAGE